MFKVDFLIGKEFGNFYCTIAYSTMKRPPFTTTPALATSAKATGLAPPSIPAHPNTGSCQNLAGSRSELSVLKENFAGFNLSPPATNSVDVWPILEARFQPFPLVFWDMPKNKSDSK
ncbi:unnamed protein product [Prunus armeniaca]